MLTTLDIKKAEMKLMDACNGLPLGVAYLLVRSKADELGRMYEAQAEREYYAATQVKDSQTGQEDSTPTTAGQK